MDETRIPPLAPDELPEELRHVLGLRPGGADQPLNVFLTIARHRELFDAWLPFGAFLLTNGALPARDRQLAILRTGFNCGSAYEWGQHTRISRAVGVPDDDIARVPAGPGAEGWSDHDAAVLRAADELHRCSRIEDATWAALAGAYDERQLLELCFVIGQYHMVAFALRSCGVAPEEGLEPLPEPPG